MSVIRISECDPPPCLTRCARHGPGYKKKHGRDDGPEHVGPTLPDGGDFTLDNGGIPEQDGGSVRDAPRARCLRLRTWRAGVVRRAAGLWI